MSVKQIQMKTIKKFKEKEEEAKEGPKSRIKSEIKPESLYDADMDDLDSSDLGEQEKSRLKSKNSSKYEPEMVSNISAMR